MFWVRCWISNSSDKLKYLHEQRTVLHDIRISKELYTWAQPCVGDSGRGYIILCIYFGNLIILTKLSKRLFMQKLNTRNADASPFPENVEKFCNLHHICGKKFGWPVPRKFLVAPMAVYIFHWAIIERCIPQHPSAKFGNSIRLSGPFRVVPGVGMPLQLGKIPIFGKMTFLETNICEYLFCSLFTISPLP